MRSYQIITLLAIRSVSHQAVAFSPMTRGTSALLASSLSSSSSNHRHAPTTKKYSSSTAISASTMKDLAEGVLKNPQYPPEWPFSPNDFERQDESDDSIFYDQPRLVYHIDDSCVDALTKYYSKTLKDGDDVLVRIECAVCLLTVNSRVFGAHSLCAYLMHNHFSFANLTLYY